MQLDLESGQSADGPQRARIVIQPFQTVDEYVFYFGSWTKAQCERF